MQTTDESPDFTRLDDPAFLAERARARVRACARVRGLLEYQPQYAVGRARLERLYAAMTEEFARRARIASTPAKLERHI
jgi:hypothetical protein